MYLAQLIKKEKRKREEKEERKRKKREKRRKRGERGGGERKREREEEEEEKGSNMYPTGPPLTPCNLPEILWKPLCPCVSTKVFSLVVGDALSSYEGNHWAPKGVADRMRSFSKRFG